MADDRDHSFAGVELIATHSRGAWSPPRYRVRRDAGMPKQLLLHRLPVTAIAFRGYNVTNLGRTGELLAHQKFGPVAELESAAASAIASDLLHRPVDLVARVRSGEEETLATYGEALAFILAVEGVQLQLLHEFFGVDWKAAKFSFGFSLGEVVRSSRAAFSRSKPRWLCSCRWPTIAPACA